MNEDEAFLDAYTTYALEMSSRFPIFIARDKYTPWRRSNRPYTRTQSTGKNGQTPVIAERCVSAISDVARGVGISNADAV